MKKLPIHGLPRRRRGRTGVSSFETHVIVVSKDGIRCTGRARVGVRFTREELVAAGRTDILACDGIAPRLATPLAETPTVYLGRKVRTERVK